MHPDRSEVRPADESFANVMWKEGVLAVLKCSLGKGPVTLTAALLRAEFRRIWAAVANIVFIRCWHQGTMLSACLADTGHRFLSLRIRRGAVT